MGGPKPQQPPVLRLDGLACQPIAVAIRRGSLSAAPNTPGLGLGLLVALVVGSILGSGIFALPQNMAVGAGAGAILKGWTVSGVGMLMLARVYQMLSLRKPDGSAVERPLARMPFCRMSRDSWRHQPHAPGLGAAEVVDVAQSARAYRSQGANRCAKSAPQASRQVVLMVIA